MGSASTSQPELPFDLKIERMERSLAAAKQLRQIALEFPELIAELFEQPSGPLRVSQPEREIERKRLSNYAIIRHHFATNNNPWLQAPQIGKQLGLSRGTVATVLWTTHAGEFEKRPVPGSVKKKEWRLKPDALGQNGKEAK